MTPKQQRFVQEYLIDLNATQAAIRAGYSKATAYEIGHQNLNKLEIQAALEEAFAARSKRVEIDQDLVIRELAAIATIDIRKLFAEDGAPRPILVRRDVTSEPHAFFNTSAPMQKYTEIGVTPDSHIVIAFERTKTLGPNGEVRTFPKPAGMSGSPVWLLHDEIGPNDPTRTLVVGVFIEYKKSHHVMIATDIGIALRMIN